VARFRKEGKERATSPLIAPTPSPLAQASARCQPVSSSLDQFQLDLFLALLHGNLSEQPLFAHTRPGAHVASGSGGPAQARDRAPSVSGQCGAGERANGRMGAATVRDELPVP